MPDFIPCQIPACPAVIHPSLPFCRYHWRLVPVPLREAVWEAYRPVQPWDVPAYWTAGQAVGVAVRQQEEETV